ncbi:PepSY domain-containing protein [Gammaproteobacteria bacterium]|nr:PepSY domain-containing protein [Gammaproteobacteria bacterium]
MKKRFSIRKIHRYLSIFIAVQLLLWTISGIYFAFNKIEMVRGEQYRLPLEIEYRIFKRLGQEIIETNDNGVKTYSTHPENSAVNILSAEEAMTIAKETTSLNPVSVSLIEKAERGVEYRGRRLPIYKVSTDTDDGINIYVDSMTGDIAAIRSDSWRAWDLLWALHIMDYQDRDNINNILLKIFSVLALISSITGIILFFKKTI